jgi:hypothetical protein
MGNPSSSAVRRVWQQGFRVVNIDRGGLRCAPETEAQLHGRRATLNQNWLITPSASGPLVAIADTPYPRRDPPIAIGEDGQEPRMAPAERG